MLVKITNMFTICMTQKFTGSLRFSVAFKNGKPIRLGSTQAKVFTTKDWKDFRDLDSMESDDDV